MKKIAIALFALVVGGLVAAQVQFPQTLPANTVWGRLGIGSGPGQAIPFALLTGNLLQSVTGDCTATVAGVITCTKTGGVPFAPSATTDTTSASNISGGTLANARLTGVQNAIKGAATSAVETDLAVPSCSSSNNFLQWTTNTGFGCAAASASTPRSYLAGNTLSGGGSTTLTITAGQATSDDQTTSMALGSTYTKTFAAWAVGSGNGGLDTGAIAANTWYHVYIIERLDTQVVDVLISLSPTTPTFPTNYSVKRRIGSVRTDATPNIIAFNQSGDEFLWAVSTVDVNVATLVATSRTLFALTVPSGIKVNALFRAIMSNASVQVGIMLTSPDETDQAATVSGNIDLGTTQVTNQFAAGRYNVRTNTSQQIAARASVASTTLQIGTMGWVDTRGRFN